MVTNTNFPAESAGQRSCWKELNVGRGGVTVGLYKPKALANIKKSNANLSRSFMYDIPFYLSQMHTCITHPSDMCKKL